jgi:hypothetical protein
MHVIYTSKGMSKSLGCLLYIRCVLSIEKYSNLTFFFVPRTSIYELSSTFFAQFRYVYRIFLSGRVSKIQGNLSVQNSTLCAHETGRNFSLNYVVYDFCRYLALGTCICSVQQQSANILEVHLPCYRFSIVITSW